MEKPPVWLAAGLRTPFARVDGPLADRDALALSVPLVRAMVGQVSGRIDLGIWESVLRDLAYSNLARERAWLERLWAAVGLPPCTGPVAGLFRVAAAWVSGPDRRFIL